jgi:hypothetical protein
VSGQTYSTVSTVPQSLQYNKLPPKYQYGYQKSQNVMLISNSLMPAFKNAPKEVESKKPRKNVKKRKYSRFAVFWAIAF